VLSESPSEVVVSTGHSSAMIRKLSSPWRGGGQCRRQPAEMAAPCLGALSYLERLCPQTGSAQLSYRRYRVATDWATIWHIATVGRGGPEAPITSRRKGLPKTAKHTNNM